MTDVAAKSLDLPVTKREARLADYIAIARLDHSTKHVFILPGIVLATLLVGVQSVSIVASVILGFVAAIAIASANYVINEWLDRDFDRHHPAKSQRSAVQTELRGDLVWLQWSILLTIGLGAAALVGTPMLVVVGVFALQGIVYNVPPIRTKNKVYLDVISESINNPLRLMIGWLMVDPTTLPPSSIIVAYWLGGAFLMAAKRLSEYREIVAAYGKDRLTRYRASFKGYTETSLVVSCFVYTIMSTFALAVFLIKYRIEYLLLLPVITALFAQYLALAMQPGSSAQKPEKLFREARLIVLMAMLAAIFTAMTVVDLPGLDILTRQKFIPLS